MYKVTAKCSVCEKESRVEMEDETSGLAHIFSSRNWTCDACLPVGLSMPSTKEHAVANLVCRKCLLGVNLIFIGPHAESRMAVRRNHFVCHICQEKKSDGSESSVDHPPHYTDHPSGIECIDVVRHMNFNIGNAIKYLWRHGKKEKHKTIEDLQKAIFYIKDEIKKIETLSNQP